MHRHLLALACLALSNGAIRPPDDAIGRELAEIRASADEERWRLIPWATSLTDTLAEAARSNRPVFFFGADGDLDTGNC